MPDEEQSSHFLEQIIESTLQALSENDSFDEEPLGSLAGTGRFIGSDQI